MFCSKCGKTIDDNATFCSFCGATQTPAAQNAAPQQAAPQQGVPQYGAPQQGAPQYGAPQQGAPQYGAPQGQYGYPAQPAPTLTPASMNVINMIFKGVLAVLGILVLIGAIGSLASLGAGENATTIDAQNKAIKAIQDFVGLARVPAIIAFSFAVVDAVFTFATKQRSVLTYVNAGIGVILFTFNFVMYGSLNDGSKSGFIVAGVFLLIGSVALLISTALTLLKKEQLLFRPKYQNPPMPPTYPPYQQ